MKEPRQFLLASLRGRVYDIVMQETREKRLCQPINSFKRALTEPSRKRQLAVLAAMGLTVSDAVRLLLTRIAREKALPFAPLTPNTVTIEAMKEARRGGLSGFDSVNALMDDLNAKD